MRNRLMFAALLALAAWQPGHSQAPVLTRDIDKRPLPAMSRASLSPAIQKAVKAMEDDQRKDTEDRDLGELKITISSIPVAPHNHKLYLVAMDGDRGCTGNGPNCRTAVLDETAKGIATIDDNGFTGIAVVRRSNLQLPDIAFYEQEGHFGTSTTVYRFDGVRWRPYLCKYVSPIGDDSVPAVVADRPCTP